MRRGILKECVAAAMLAALVSPLAGCGGSDDPPPQQQAAAPAKGSKGEYQREHPAPPSGPVGVGFGSPGGQDGAAERGPLPARTASDKKLDVAFIPADAVAAFVVHPQQILSSPLMASFPKDKAAEFQLRAVAETGLDPHNVKEVVLLMGLAGTMPEMRGAIIRVVAPVQQEELSEKLTAGGQFKVAMPDDTTILVASEADLEKMQAQPAPQSKLIELLQETDAGLSAVGVADMQALRPFTSNAVPPMQGQGPMDAVARMPNELEHVQLSVDLSESLNLELAFGAQDEQTAQSYTGLFADLTGMAEKQLPMLAAPGGGPAPLPMQMAQTIVPDLLKRLQNRVEGKIFHIGFNLPVTPEMKAMAVNSIQGAQDAEESMVAMNNLKEIGLAFHNFHDVTNALPAAASVSADGKPLLSWRVHVLPYLEERDLYKEFHLDEAWDSEHNQTLIARMPDVFKSPDVASPAGKTPYLAVIGEGSVFGSETPMRFPDMKDGNAMTVLVVEADPALAVEWTRPDDYKVNPALPGAGLGQARSGKLLVLFGDGSVRTLTMPMNPETLMGLFTANGSEPIDDSTF